MTTSSKRKTKKKAKIDKTNRTNGKAGAGANGTNSSANSTGPSATSIPRNLFDVKRLPNQLPMFKQAGNVAPWLWCLSEFHINDSNKQLIADLYQATTTNQKSSAKVEKLYQLGMAQLESGEFATEDVLVGLAWIAWCVSARKNLTETQLTHASQRIREFINHLPHITLEEDPLANQVLGCEAALTVARLFNSYEELAPLAKAAINKWADSIDQLLDGDGWINARYWTLMRPLLACWTRCSMIADSLKLKLPKERRLQLEWLIRQALRSTRKDGLQLLVTPRQEFGMKKFWLAAVDQFGDKEDRLAAATILKTPELANGTRKSDVPEFSGISEWAGTAVMRQSWQRNAPKIAVVFNDRQVHIEIENRKSLVTDFTLPMLSFDNTILEVESDIEVACWHSDDDVDYLELEIHYSNDVVLQRQILLARDDEFAFLADAVCSPNPGLLHYTARYPVSSDMSLMNETETNELYIKDKSIRALVLPLSVPEWQIEKSRNACHNDGQSWTIEQQVNDQYLYAPMFIDLNSRRSKKPRTWRHLTVAEKLDIIHNDSVRGYRVQIGKEQWVFFRSLAPVASRTFLGQNVNCEFFAARFDQYGETEELLSID